MNRRTGKLTIKANCTSNQVGILVKTITPAAVKWTTAITAIVY
jgi:hypothetical protein